MAAPCLYSMGGSRIVDASGQSISLAQLKSIVLLHFLVEHRDHWFERAYLAQLFWPQASPSAAREHLRKRLHEVRQALSAIDTHALHITGTSLRFSPSCIWWLETQAVASADVATIGRLKRRHADSVDFLGTVQLDDCEALMAWLQERREHYRALLESASMPVAALKMPEQVVSGLHKSKRFIMLLVVYLDAHNTAQPDTSPGTAMAMLDLALTRMERAGGFIVSATTVRVVCAFGFPSTDGKQAYRSATALHDIKASMHQARGALCQGWVWVDYSRGLVDLRGQLLDHAEQLAAGAAPAEFVMEPDVFNALSICADLSPAKLSKLPHSSVFRCQQLRWLQRAGGQWSKRRGAVSLPHAFSAMLRVARKHSPVPLFVAGHAGAGKSAAIDHWLEQVDWQEGEQVLLVDGHLNLQSKPFGALAQALHQRWPQITPVLDQLSVGEAASALQQMWQCQQTHLFVLLVDHYEWLDTATQTLLGHWVRTPPALRACLIICGRIASLDVLPSQDTFRVKVLRPYFESFATSTWNYSDVVLAALDRCHAALPLLDAWFRQACHLPLPSALATAYREQVQLLAREGLICRSSHEQLWSMSDQALWHIVGLTLAES